MSVKVVNRSQYDSAEVRRIVRAVLKDFECDDVQVTVIHRRGQSGHAGGQYREYWYPSRKEDRPQIRISLPKPGILIDRYHPYERRGAPEPFEMKDWREALVAACAHEANHHRQAPRNSYGRKRGRFIEVECDWAAYRAVMRFRRSSA